MEKNIFLLASDTCYGIACPLAEIESYHAIYEIKKRSTTKPLSILVPDFYWLENHTFLEKSDIDFLKKYPHPFSVVTDSQELDVLIRMQIENENGDVLQFGNVDAYDGFSFRIANTEEQKTLISEFGPLWLTSANMSDQGEIYDFDQLKKTFKKYENILKYEISPSQKKLPKKPASDIFYFTDDDEIEYIRQNYH